MKWEQAPPLDEPAWKKAPAQVQNQIGPGANVPPPLQGQPDPHTVASEGPYLKPIDFGPPSLLERSIGPALNMVPRYRGLNVQDKFSPSTSAGLISAGKEFADLGRGVRSLLGADVEEENEASRQAMLPIQKAHPAASMVGGMAPYMAMPAGMFSQPAGKAVSLLGATKTGERLGQSLLADAAIGGGTVGALNYNDDALWGAAMGAAGFTGMQKAARVFSKPPNFNSKTATRIIERARKDLDWEFMPGERTGSRTLQMVDQHLKTNQATAEWMSRKTARNQQKANAIAAKELGMDSDELSSDVLLNASDAIDKKFRDLAGSSTAKFSNDEVDRMVQAITNYEQYPGSNPIVRDWADLLFDSLDNNGRLSGTDYKRLQTRLRQKATTLKMSAQGDRDAGIELDNLRGILDDAMERGSTKKGEWKDVRRKYAILKILENPQVTNPISGDVNLIGLARHLDRFDKKGFTKGKNASELYLLGRVGQLDKAQRGQSLSMSHGLSEMLRGPNKVQDVTKAVLNKSITGLGVPTLGQIGAGIYSSGYPAVSGLLGPLSLPGVAPGLLGSLAGRATYGEGVPWLGVGNDELQSLLSTQFGQ